MRFNALIFIRSFTRSCPCLEPCWLKLRFLENPTHRLLRNCCVLRFPSRECQAILRPQSGGASLEDYVSIVTRGEGLSTQKLCVGRSRRAYSSFGIAADRRHTLKWLFHQEKATFLCTQEVYTNSENALKCAGPDGLPHRIVAATGSVLTPPSQVGSLHKGAYGRFKPLSALQQRPRRLARPRTPPFHGDNAGSNPAGDAI